MSRCTLRARFQTVIAAQVFASNSATAKGGTSNSKEPAAKVEPEKKGIPQLMFLGEAAQL
jgi:hypothetical protein